MKIMADENIPYVHEFFDRFGEVRTAPGRQLTRQHLADIDILLVRSVTRVDETLLAGTPVKFVGTCTIGQDHLDLPYLQLNHIVFASAPGCNAGGVIQYDLAALALLEPQWQKQQIGVVGSGNVGGRLCKALDVLGVDYVAYDPFLAVTEHPHLADFETVIGRDIVCMHTPYTTAGPHPTHHLLAAPQLAKMKPAAILLNAGRGGAIDNQALSQHLRKNSQFRVALDVWEHEPNVNLDLMDQVHLGSPHIAGYSFEGKLNGSAMVFAALVDFLGLDRNIYLEQCHRLTERLKGPPVTIECQSLNHAIQQSYDIKADDLRFRAGLSQAQPQALATRFDELRKFYPERREFSHYFVQCNDPELKRTLGNVGFLIDE